MRKSVHSAGEASASSVSRAPKFVLGASDCTVTSAATTATGGGTVVVVVTSVVVVVRGGL
jgi:hypothetical protein